MGPRARLRAAGFGLMVLGAAGIGFVALRYFSLSPDAFFPEQRDVYRAHLPMLLAHVGGGAVALIAGPWQFWTRLRAGAPRVHRVLGRTYLLGVAVGGAGGLYMAPLAFGGWPARAGFLALSLLWLASSWLAFVAIRGGRIRVHRRWMIRSYALTFAAVTLRAWLPLLQAVGLSFVSAYVAVAWLSWMPNLLVCEWVLMRERNRARMPGAAPTPALE